MRRKRLFRFAMTQLYANLRTLYSAQTQRIQARAGSNESPRAALFENGRHFSKCPLQPDSGPFDFDVSKFYFIFQKWEAEKCRHFANLASLEASGNSFES